MFRLFDKSLKILLALLGIVMIVVGFMQVFFRYVLQQPLTWSEELLRYIFIWIVLVGAPVGVPTGSHVSFDLLEKKVPMRYKRAYKLLLFLLMLAGFAFMAVVGFPYAIKNLDHVSSAMRIPFGIIILAVPVGGAVGIVYTVEAIRQLFMEKEEG